MGKVKIEMKKLEEENNWRSTFAKRGNGVLKKACELSILCDIDVAIIAFSLTGKLLYYCNTSVADVIKRFADVNPKRYTEIARASGGVRFVSQPKVKREPHQFHPQGTISAVGMTPSTCATAVRFLPQIDIQQVVPLQAVPPIVTAFGIPPGEKFQDGIYMRKKITTSQPHHASFRHAVQAAYDKACHLNQIQHAHQSVDYKKAIREDKGFGASLWLLKWQ